MRIYLKLPAWFKVTTPIGDYNPDWAIVFEERDAHGKPTGEGLLYLVRETKSATWQTTLRPAERRKIVCGKRHFEGALGVRFQGGELRRRAALSYFRTTKIWRLGSDCRFRT